MSKRGPQLVYLLCWVDVHADPVTEGRIGVTGLWHEYPHRAQKNMWLKATEIDSCGISICSVILHSSAFPFSSTLCLTNKWTDQKPGECHRRHKAGFLAKLGTQLLKGCSGELQVLSNSNFKWVITFLRSECRFLLWIPGFWDEMHQLE